ncbi:Glycosyltransferase involved in cell wall bisynthesis [Salinimicrobium sediminis]|uniref:Glycosyltransferase involved in cell wall bisynthesis n=1 Tax=Salinimicrobium sediminis TaxID=1343891 RepID=A0A285WZL3_9FLAO|nr:Glycosyltransferase involved in cell wall bisynthesis [Salinimicrobium sediminis]
MVSICIPTFNGEKYILEALESAIAQTYTNLEIIISDDASTDNTLKCIKKIKQKTDIPIHIYHHRPSGIGANWNNCIKNASGEYIKFLFQDDILYPTCVEELVNVLTSDEKVGLVACKRSILVEGEASAETERWKSNFGNLQEGIELNTKESYTLDFAFLKDEKFIKNNKVGEPSTVLFSRALVKKVGLFREDLIQVLDIEFYYRILKHRKILIVDKELVAFRIHPAQATNVNKNKISKDYEKYYRLLYRNFFWYLDYKTQKKLIKRFHPIGKLYHYLRR